MYSIYLVGSVLSERSIEGVGKYRCTAQVNHFSTYVWINIFYSFYIFVTTYNINVMSVCEREEIYPLCCFFIIIFSFLLLQHNYYRPTTTNSSAHFITCYPVVRYLVLIQVPGTGSHGCPVSTLSLYTHDIYRIIIKSKNYLFLIFYLALLFYRDWNLKNVKMVDGIHSCIALYYYYLK